MFATLIKSAAIFGRIQTTPTIKDTSLGIFPNDVSVFYYEI